VAGVCNIYIYIYIYIYIDYTYIYRIHVEVGEASGKGQGMGSSVAATAQATIVAATREPKKLKAPYFSSSRPHTLVAQGLLKCCRCSRG
jgi:hypothetical protein